MIETPQLDATIEKAIPTKAVGRAHKLMASRAGVWCVAALSFIEAALPVPFITDPFLIAGIMANRTKQRAVSLFVITTASSVLGGVTAFALAFYFFSYISGWMTPGTAAEFQDLVAMNSSGTFLATIIGAMTPVPYTIVAWVIAVGQGSFWVFLGGSILGRGGRYAIVAASTYYFGPTAVRYARRSIAITSIILLVLAGVYVWLKM